MEIINVITSQVGFPCLHFNSSSQSDTWFIKDEYFNWYHTKKKNGLNKYANSAANIQSVVTG